MKVIDFKKDPTYKAKTEPAIVEVPEMLFIMVDGRGAPETSKKGYSDFQIAFQVLFGIVYTVKFWDKQFKAPKGYAKFTLAPVEGQWWMADVSSFDTAKPDDWRWTLMLRVPEFVTPDYFKTVVNEITGRKHSDIYKLARLETFEEGTCVQLMHIGPYDQEAPNIEKMHAFAKDNGYKLKGHHHELYFGDPRRTKPEKLRTILRQPLEKF